jgi:hypothetical protein
MPLFMWSRTDRGSCTILSRTVCRLVPLRTLTLPVWSGMFRLPSVPCETHRRTLVAVEPGSMARPVMVRANWPNGVTMSGGPLNFPVPPLMGYR